MTQPAPKKAKTWRRVAIAACVAVALCAGLAAVAWRGLMREAVTSAPRWVYVDAGGQMWDGSPKATDGSSRPIDVADLSPSPYLRWALRHERYYERARLGELTGAYRLEAGMSALQVARRLARHQQTPVRVTFTATRRADEWAGRLARQLMCDSAQLMSTLYDPARLAAVATDSAHAIAHLLPDTYEVYWDIGAPRMLDRLEREYARYWDERRVAKAQALGLTPDDAATLASIAEEETRDRHERGVVARLYLNRLERHMLLQADPTVKYAVGDPTLTRILTRHLEVASPYNTYLHEGLPPGPIRMVDKATIDTLLDARPHDYLYMCAKPDFSGRHNFATSYSQHLRNAEAYHRALDARQSGR